VLCEPLGEGQHQLLLLVVARGVLESWMEVMDQAGCRLHALQPACLCQWNGVVPLRQVSAHPLQLQGLLLAGAQQSWLSLLCPHHPVAQWCLPEADGLWAGLEPLRFLMGSDAGTALGVAPRERPELLVVADGAEPERIQAWMATQAEALPWGVRLVDPMRMGWLQGTEISQTVFSTAGIPWLLWGLAAPDLQASSS